MSRYLIIGGLGFIGSSIAKELIEEGEEVFILDNFQFGDIQKAIPATIENFREKRWEAEYRINSLRGKCELIFGDYAWFPYTLKVNPDYIIVAAGPSIPKEVLLDPVPASRSMIGGTLNMLGMMKSPQGDSNLKKVVYLSSSMVYGDTMDSPISEDHPTNPIEPYGIFKLACEQLFKCYYFQDGIPYNIVRLSGVYGPGDGKGRVLERFLDQALKGQDLHVRNSIIDFTYIDDAVNGILKVLHHAKPTEIYNISKGEGRNLHSAADFISENLVFGVNIIPGEEEGWRPQKGSLDISKASREFGYYPKTHLETGLKIYFEHIRKRRDALCMPEI